MVGEDPADHVVADIVAGVAHVAVGVDGGTTCVPVYVAAIEGHKLLLTMRQMRTNSLVRLFLSLRLIRWLLFIVSWRTKL